MNRITPGILVLIILGSIIAGGIGGFFLGVLSTKAGKAFIADIFQEELLADIKSPKNINQERYMLQYPGNWKLNIEDEDFDLDSMFSIDSPGNTFVMFVLNNGEIDSEESIKDQIHQFEKIMSNSIIERFEKFGKYSGKGAIMKGKNMGIKMTVKLFSFTIDDFSIMITQQCPDEDLLLTQDGLKLIENSFEIINPKPIDNSK